MTNVNSDTYTHIYPTLDQAIMARVWDEEIAMSNKSIPYDNKNALVARNVGELETLGRVCADSGFFQDSKQAAQAMVKIAAGQELGLPPIQAMTGIHVSNGRITLGANLIATLLRKAGYRWEMEQFDATVCKLIMFDPNGNKIGPSSFSMDDARAASLQTKDVWKKYPRNMLFARAISNAARWYAPEVTTGCYTPEEMGDMATADGILDAEFTELPHEVTRRPQQLQHSPQPHPAHQNRDEHPSTIEIDRPQDGTAPATPPPGVPVVKKLDPENERKRFFATANEKGLTEEQQRLLLGVNSRSDATPQRLNAISKALKEWGDTERQLALTCLESDHIDDMRQQFKALPEATQSILKPACAFRAEQLKQLSENQAA